MIPGLGRFFLDRLPASFSVDRLQINPPSYHLRFEKDFIQQDKESLKVLQKYHPQANENDFSTYSKELVDKLLQRGYIKIDDLGKLHFRDGEIIYEKDILTQSMLSSGFPELAIANLKSLFPPLAPILLERFHPLSSYWARWIPFAIALLLALGVLGLSSKIKNTSLTYPPKKETKPPIIIDTLGVSNRDTQNSTTNINDVDSIVKSIEDIGVNDNGIVTKKCIIVTGAYRTAKYKDIMIQNLKTRGLKVFTETTTSGLTRVGFEFECAETDLKQYLDSIRSAIQNDAWYLMPDFSKKQG